MKKVFTLLFLALSISAFSQKTYVYFQNNTSLSFSVRCTQTGDHVMESSEWWGSNTAVSPWQRNTLMLWTNRDAGVHSGMTFYHTVFLKSGSDSVQLKLKMTGSLIGSSIWASAAGPGFSHPWYSDRNFHSQTFTLNGKSMTIKYAFYFTGGYDDILYSVHENDPFPVNAADLSNPRKVNILTQNAYMRPSELFFDDQDTRKDYYDDLLHNYDAIIFQELFDDDVRQSILNQLAAEYPYQTSVVDIPNHGALDPVQDGGILIVSRWPIEAQDQYLFGNNCNEDDCLAYKGFKYGKINKLGVPYHIFGTHMDAFNEQVDVQIRLSQLQSAKTFIASKNIPVSEAVLFGGDLNIDKLTNKWGEYDSLWTSFFGAQEPTYGNPLNPSWNSLTNTYLSSTSDAPEYLDYVLPMTSHLLPTTNVNSVTPYRTVVDAMWKKFDISDHYGVKGSFEYPGSVPGCATATGLTVSAIGQTTASVSWSAVSGSAGYNVRYKTTSSSTWTSATSTATSLILSGLTSATQYEVQVQSKCSGLLNSNWSSSVLFTTLAVPTCTDTYEANESRTTAKTIAAGTDITAKIATATDADWFKFSSTNTQKNIRVTLNNLPANYDLQLYDSKGNLLRTSANTGTTGETVTYNASKSATYYVRVYGVSGANNSACYTLRASLSSTAVRLSETEVAEMSASLREPIFYPNPVSDRFMIEFDLEADASLTLSVYDVYGKLVSAEDYAGAAGANAVYHSVNELPAGFYVVSLTGPGDAVYTGKFVKN